MGVRVKKKIKLSLDIPCTWNGETKGRYVLPNKFLRAIGPFVLFEYILSYQQSPGTADQRLITNCSHAHRGIATLTYLINGEVEHLDSIGNHEVANSGCVHWTKAAQGIVYREIITAKANAMNANVSIVRLWINLPSKHKVEKPVYSLFKEKEIPKKKLDDNAGWVKIISGAYEKKVAKIPCYSKEFLFHVHLEAGKQFSITTDITIECAAFLPAHKAVVNGKSLRAGEFIAFASFGETIEIKNSSKTSIDIFLFGGEPYHEAIVSEESFVMNNPHEISQAYNDYYDGKYGQIVPRQKN